MIANLANLSEALDQAAPDRKLVELIRANKREIESEFARGESFILTMNGRKFRIVPKTRFLRVEK